ncbi:hypothetical protein IE53DRAFT_131654 [Violaceomyces palustris]|uniref:Uncharacterized protein n=1 Tax=Violaceomyces palustris TaxID=1673888 RepID=A0ACD0NV47_9BASI|nr:hypothetical protein IE53DRAFT_131654 [Violaceomyces palustris]
MGNKSLSAFLLLCLVALLAKAIPTPAGEEKLPSLQLYSGLIPCALRKVHSGKKGNLFDLLGRSKSKNRDEVAEAKSAERIMTMVRKEILLKYGWLLRDIPLPNLNLRIKTPERKFDAVKSPPETSNLPTPSTEEATLSPHHPTAPPSTPHSTEEPEERVPSFHVDPSVDLDSIQEPSSPGFTTHRIPTVQEEQDYKDWMTGFIVFEEAELESARKRRWSWLRRIRDKLKSVLGKVKKNLSWFNREKQNPRDWDKFSTSSSTIPESFERLGSRPEEKRLVDPPMSPKSQEIDLDYLERLKEEKMRMEERQAAHLKANQERWLKESVHFLQSFSRDRSGYSPKDAILNPSEG